MKWPDESCPWVSSKAVSEGFNSCVTQQPLYVAPWGKFLFGPNIRTSYSCLEQWNLFYFTAHMNCVTD